ncbi:MAG: hypothetical protein GVY29_06270, partial [Spirochaetes bacterium]|nr:hypothetical protein [Spirochaetota bacterium]
DGTLSLPRLASLTAEFDCISVSGSLEHVADRDLLEVLYHLRRLLLPNGLLILSVPDPADGLELESVGRRRAPEQYRFFLSRLGLDVSHREHARAKGSQKPEPSHGADGYVTLIFRAAGGQGLRPIETLESILVEDRKVNSYKYALLRALANLAIHRYNAVDWLQDGRVALPWRLIADEWIGYYWPIVEVDVVSGGPGGAAGSAGLGLSASGSRGDGHAPPSDGPAILQGQKIKGKSDFAFRAGLTELACRFAGAGGYAAFSRSRDAGQLSSEARDLYRGTIRKLKAAIGRPVHYAGNERTTKGLFELAGDQVLLPGALWSELSVMGRWVIDSISLRWADFTLGLRHQTPGLTREAILALLLPADNADRDVALAQAAFDRRRQESSDGRIECVWSGERVARFDVDHAIPFALWGNNDLWNLLPAAPAVNNAKRAKLPERALIERRRAAIVEAWEMLYESERGLFLAHAGSFTGRNWGDFGRRQQDELFSTFKDAVEYTARNRVAERWAG